ncbi:TetR/AcrR family transcriptional regulator [Streptomyces sp. NPDC059477]|uniref:TetR/AcrR family transcriptional regulator n=1 Tax=Streptomyces sp. NPDC059477 TaxID=3346847 RepID=UPI0036975E88
MGTSRAGHGSSRDRILDAAETLFSTRGYADVTISQVCRESGLPVGSIYHHFTNKFGLLSAVVERASVEFFDAMPVPGELPGDPLERLGAYYDGAVDVISDRVRLMRLMYLLRLQEHNDRQIESLVREANNRVRAELAAAIEPVTLGCGVPDAKGLAKELAELTLSFTAGLVVFTDDRGDHLRAGLRRLRQLVLGVIAESATEPSAALRR